MSKKKKKNIKKKNSNKIKNSKKKNNIKKKNNLNKNADSKNNKNINKSNKTNGKKVKNKTLKSNKKFSLMLLFFLVVPLLLFIIYFVYLKLSKPSVDGVILNDNDEIVVSFKKTTIESNFDIYCLFNTSGNVPDINDSNWFLVSNNSCSYVIDDNIYYGYFKYGDKVLKIDNVEKTGKIKNIVYDDLIYIAVNGKSDIKLSYDKIGYINEEVKFEIFDNDIISVSEDGVITGNKIGSTTLFTYIEDNKLETKITVTDLITSKIKEDGYDFSKPELECGEYTKEENDLLDKILVERINDAGYQTRAGAVEAARFLLLEFPYKISYFYENGRLTGNKVDGEGRYYHTGLYLDESRYENISKSAKGPKTWGCSLYSNPAKRKIDNGLDCSGYVTWALLNAGYDPGDIGAGITASFDLTNLGEVKNITTSLIKSNKIKVGDLVHSNHTGGHIGIIIGIDENNFYVGQALWNDASHKLTKRKDNVMAVQITKYSFSEMGSVFPHVVLMDKYYKEDGNLTNMW